MVEAVGISLRLLGPFEIAVGGAPARTIEIATRRGRALLAYLSLRPDFSETRERLALSYGMDRIARRGRACGNA